MKKRKKTKTQLAEKKCWKACSHFIRTRDSRKNKHHHESYEGFCCSCRKLCSGRFAHAGHYKPKGASNAFLKYHPHNIHLQCASCNVAMSSQRAETVKVEYARFMYKKYSKKYVENLFLKGQKTIRADVAFYEKLTELFEIGNEAKIIRYLNKLIS